MTKLYLDFDSFFASAEQHFNPALRGKPVGVVPIDAPNAACVALSREAKAAGVPSHSRIDAAREVLPECTFVVARPDAYVRLHHRVLAVIERCVPVGEVRSIDELVCDLVQSEADDAAALIQRIKTALRGAFGPTLTCSIGVAPTEMLAKVAAESCKPDGASVWRADELQKRIVGMPLRTLPGISDGMEARLKAAGVADVCALWHVEPKRARAIWGSIEGERFWNALHGLTYDRPATTKRMFGHSRILTKDWRNARGVRACGRQLVLSAARRLRRAGYRATKMTLGARDTRYGSGGRHASKDARWSSELVFDPARDDLTLLSHLTELVDRFDCDGPARPRSVSVMLHGLTQEDTQQGDLFAATEPTHDRRDALSDALDELRARHGPNAASIGPRVDLPGGYLGAKIAFGRIPDLADFSDAFTKDSDTHFCTV